MDWSSLVPLILFGALSAGLVVIRLRSGRCAAPGFLGYLWAFLLVFLVADWISFTLSAWCMAFLSFQALREYFSLVDLRIEDRWGVLGAYLSILFMIILITVGWYGFFIVSIPVYAFLVIPFLVALGDSDGRGSVLSIGAIDFGLFFFVYCIGHIAYLASASVWAALFLVLAVAACTAIYRWTAPHGKLVGWLTCCVACLLLAGLLVPWTGIPMRNSIFTGFLIPVLVLMGDFTVGVLERDMGVQSDDLEPGRGRVCDSLKAYLFTAPVVFHYVRWSTELL